MDRIENFEDYYVFQFQPIVEVNQAGEFVRICAREVLLKTKDTGRFPKDFFTAQLASESGMHQLNKRYTKMIMRYFQNPDAVPLHLNLDPKQVSMAGTWQDFEEVRPYAERIILELTEGPVVAAKQNMADADDLCASLGSFRKIGFNLALDDVGTGQNSFALAKSIIHYLNYLKFTIIPFRREINQLCLKRIQPWQTLAEKAELPLIIEAIETKEEARILAEAGLTFQQGFYWDELVDGVRHDQCRR